MIGVHENILQIPYKVGAPRPGDLACVYADPTKAAEELEWKAEFGLDVRHTVFVFFCCLTSGRVARARCNS